MKINSAIFIVGFVVTNTISGEWVSIGDITEIRGESESLKFKVLGTIPPNTPTSKKCNESYIWWEKNEPLAKEWLTIALSALNNGKLLQAYVTGGPDGNCHANMIAISN